MPNPIKLPDEVKSGDEIEVQLSPLGHFGQVVEGKDVTQIVDEEAVDNLVKNFDGDVLVDADHSSEDGGSTEAMAWVTRVFKDPDRGLVGVFNFTDKGADAVTQKRYRFISPAWTLDDAGRPQKLVSVGMTNRPNLPVAPMLNMRAVKTGASGTYAAGKAVKNGEAGAASVAEGEGVTTSHPSAPARIEGVGVAGEVPEAPCAEADGVTNENDNPNKGNPTMDIREKLGLPPEATDADVEAAIDALLARAKGVEAVNEALGLEPDATAENAVECINAVIEKCKNDGEALAGLQQEAANAEAEKFVAENEDVCECEEEKEELKQQYLDDPVAAQSCVANARKLAARIVKNAKPAEAPVAVRRVVNANAARKPVVANAAKAMEDGLAACGGDPAKENAYLVAHACK